MKPKPIIIKEALDWLKNDNNKTIVKDNKIPNIYKGYVSAFGGAVVQMGIYPACLAYMADARKKKLVEAFFTIYKKVSSVAQYPDLKNFLDNWHNMSPTDKRAFRNRMTEVMVSYKLAMRTYEFSVTNEND